MSQTDTLKNTLAALTGSGLNRYSLTPGVRFRWQA